MNKGLSPIIATMILIGIAISIGAIVSIWFSAQSQDYMYKEGERRERILNKEGESLVLVHVTFDSGTRDLTLTVQNNGTSDMEIAYLKVDQVFFRQTNLTCNPTGCQLDYSNSADVTVTLPASYDSIDDISSLEIGSTLGNLFIYNAPSPAINILSTFFDEHNLLVTFSGEKSIDDGEIVKYEWCFHYDDANDVCNTDPATSEPYDGVGSVSSFQYNDPNLGPGDYTVQLVVIDETGMVGVITIPIPIPVIT